MSLSADCGNASALCLPLPATLDKPAGISEPCQCFLLHLRCDNCRGTARTTYR